MNKCDGVVVAVHALDERGPLDKSVTEFRQRAQKAKAGYFCNIVRRQASGRVQVTHAPVTKSTVLSSEVENSQPLCAFIGIQNANKHDDTSLPPTTHRFSWKPLLSVMVNPGSKAAQLYLYNVIGKFYNIPGFVNQQEAMENYLLGVPIRK